MKPWLRYRDFMVFGVPNKTAPFDLLGSVPIQMRQSFALIFENLVRINSEQVLEPVLAASWEVEPGGKAMVIQLQAGHFFSDGTPVDSIAVQRSFLKVCAQNGPAADDLSGLKNCRRRGHGSQKNSEVPAISVISPLRVRFEITINPTLFLYQLTSSRVAVAHWLGTEVGTEPPLGSGPYRLLEKENEYLVLERNPHYHPEAKVRNKGLIIRYINEADIRNTLKSERVDGTILYRASSMPYQPPGGYRLMDDQSNITQMLVLNNGRFPFNQKILRQAIAAEVYNRHSISQCFPLSKPAYGIIPIGLGGSVGHMAPAQMRSISPQEVFRQVKRLAHKSYKITIHRHLGRKNDCEARELEEVLRKYHLEATFKYHTDYKSLWPLYLNHDFDAYLELFVFSFREAYNILKKFDSTSSENVPNIADPKMDRLLGEVWEAPTASLRFQKYREANEYI